MVAAYHQSASTLNLLRAFTKGGFADLSQVHTWNQQFVAGSPGGQHYEALAAEIERALRFMRACGINLGGEASLQQVDFWTSHEALILGFEEAMTRRDSLTGDWYDTSAHLVWVGERTRRLDGAHLDFLSGLSNPVGGQGRPERIRPTRSSACAPSSTRTARPGRLTLITRLGAGRTPELLPPLMRRRAPGRPPGGLGVRPHARQHLSTGPAAARPVISTTCSPRSGSSSPPAGRRGPGRAASTSS